MLALVVGTAGLSPERPLSRVESSAVAPAHVSMSISAAANQRVSSRGAEEQSRARPGPFAAWQYSVYTVQDTTLSHPGLFLSRHCLHGSIAVRAETQKHAAGGGAGVWSTRCCRCGASAACPPCLLVLASQSAPLVHRQLAGAGKGDEGGGRLVGSQLVQQLCGGGGVDEDRSAGGPDEALQAGGSCRGCC